AGMDPAPASDAEVIAHLKRMSNGAKFAALFEGETEGFDSHSEADASLLSLLLWRCGGNVEQAHRLFEMSGLCRDKWTGRADYREKTTAFVLEKLAGNFYSPGHGAAHIHRGNGSSSAPPPPPPPPPGGETPAPPGGDQGPQQSATVVDPNGAYSIILRYFTT